MNKVLEDIKKTIVFFGFENDGRPYFTGTGCVISLNNVFHLVTAKPVVLNDDKFREDSWVFVNDKDGKNTFAFEELKRVVRKGNKI